LAVKREKALCKFREESNLENNIDLTYCVSFTLARMYHANGMFTESLDTYSQIVKNSAYIQSGRLRVNMGNIYFQQKKYPLAIKMYRMALDPIMPQVYNDLRYNFYFKKKKFKNYF
jgi:intraflagellar transport protein 88